ncbi:MAG: acetolactate synthase, large subunit, biosynthetic type [Chloroflexi bacterium CG_4_10_14_0_8_um_filter_46_9]|nr:MAG: acetolactate synthase, large subunit, biosynthetic type [Dehalococcoidia bacterium CG2_30_46_19]PIW40380.1 MAG: acetolactate synthase, large subunit, biosynthetic type [Chloroflexi bacterium CG15_BIG_FIL_POST_REV_8_21_14_020_46_15]PIZ27162.1 MAG: acetolactate synthase, large subunit, biosynthetic type [Chloroflexi bacterium CG_4_10_14_0_8_um_filter_46_9]
MKKTGAQILCESLIKEGVEVIFGILGGAILPVYDAFTQYPQLRHILVRHEQGAVHAADGYARATHKVGACIATSGPGAANLVTGIANAYMDSSPLIAITGQVARPFIGKDAFQETDITGITLPITKHNYLVYSASELAMVVKEAFYIARTGRQGPVLIDIPRDVQQEEAEFIYPDKVDLPGYKPVVQGHPAQIRKAAKLVNGAERPLIIAGRGIIMSQAYAELKELAEKAQIPVVNTLLGISSFPQNHVLSFDMLGMHGMAYANMAVQAADLIIAIGMRFDDRATAITDKFAPEARIIHIDIDPAEIGKNVRVDVPIVGDVKNVLGVLNNEITVKEHAEWLSTLNKWQREHPSLLIRESSELLPQYIVRQIYEATQGDATVVTGVGQNQMWAAQYFTFIKPNSFISSGGLGTMGFELPAAMGVKVGRPDEMVWCVAGDGGFQMTIQELATIAVENIAVKIAIINNGYLGMVRQWQELFYGHRYVDTRLWNPDFVKIAEAYEIPAIKVRHRDEVSPAICKAMDYDGPFLVDFIVEPEENVYPMVPPGKSLSEIIELPKPKRVPKAKPKILARS